MHEGECHICGRFVPVCEPHCHPLPDAPPAPVEEEVVDVVPSEPEVDQPVAPEVPEDNPPAG